MGLRTTLQRTLASHLGKPRGVVGTMVARLINKHNAPMMSGAVELADVQAGETAADLGFGGGYGLSLLLERAAIVHGVDYSPSMVERARRLYRSDRLRLHTGSMTALPLEDASVDAVITVNTVYFIDAIDTAFAELARILRPGGRAVIGIGDPANMADMPFTVHGFRLRTVAELTGLLADAGLTVAAHTRVGDDERSPHLLLVRR